jgi:hypothetical protein
MVFAGRTARELAVSILQEAGLSAVFPKQHLSAPARTSAIDLLDMGFKMKVTGDSWGDEDVRCLLDLFIRIYLTLCILVMDVFAHRSFFGACAKYKRAPGIIGGYASVYEWIGTSVLKGNRTAAQVQTFASLVYNKRRAKVSRPATSSISRGEEDDTSDEDYVFDDVLFQ